MIQNNNQPQLHVLTITKGKIDAPAMYFRPNLKSRTSTLEAHVQNGRLSIHDAMDIAAKTGIAFNLVPEYTPCKEVSKQSINN